jgi:hypothetical protein
MRWIGLLAAASLLSGGSSPARTEIVRWSPLTAAGAVKATLKVHDVGTGRCTDTYTTAGDIAYRCGRGNGIYFPCWRAGPYSTDRVLCAGDPWTRSVTRIRSPGLLLYPGVTYLDDPYSPWALELTTGQRCRLFQGAHDAVRRRGHTYVVDYYCDEKNLVLLRGPHRGRGWRIGAARYLGLRRGYKLLGDVEIRRAFFGGLPPVMERQRKLAALAVASARHVVHRSAARAHLDLAWVRLTLPDARWAYVIFSSVDDKGRFALLHRAGGAWRDASAFRPYCTTLPPRARRQLFLDRRTWKPPPLWSQGPPGEQRC